MSSILMTSILAISGFVSPASAFVGFQLRDCKIIEAIGSGGWLIVGYGTTDDKLYFTTNDVLKSSESAQKLLESYETLGNCVSSLSNER